MRFLKSFGHIPFVQGLWLLLLTGMSCSYASVEPHFLLPDSGAYFWSESATDLFGCHPLNEEARVLIIYSECRAEDGITHVYYQCKAICLQ